MDQAVRSAGGVPPFTTAPVSPRQTHAGITTVPATDGGRAAVVVVASLAVVVAVVAGLADCGRCSPQVRSITRRSSTSFWSALRSQAFFTVTQSLAYSHQAASRVGFHWPGSRSLLERLAEALT